MQHVTVLQSEAVQSLNLKPDSVVVDCTLGSGGHARSILEVLGPNGHFIGLDVDATAIASNQELQNSFKTPVTLITINFVEIEVALAKCVETHADAILADLGWRMEQFDGSSGVPRGFSFQVDEPLLMTFGTPRQYSFTAKDIVNDWMAEDIANVIYGYGQDRFSRRIAKAIVDARKREPIETSLQLAEIVAAAVPASVRRGKTHPATKTFQALRIAVNDEFSVLEKFITNAFQCLKPGGRLSIITFHSLEDRIVKHSFKDLARDQQAILINKKPLEPSREEQLRNRRARSAKLRTIEKSFIT